MRMRVSLFSKLRGAGFGMSVILVLLLAALFGLASQVAATDRPDDVPAVCIWEIGHINSSWSECVEDEPAP